MKRDDSETIGMQDWATYAGRLNWAMQTKREPISQSDLARAVGVRPQSIQYLADMNRTAQGSVHTLKIAAVLGVDADWLAHGTGSPHPNRLREIEMPEKHAPGERRIPLINFVQAGQLTEVGTNFTGDAMEYLLTDMLLSKHAFALEIRGTSMLPDFTPGDRIIVDQEVAPIAGDFVVAKNGGEEATFKKYRPRGVNERGQEVFELVPLNEDFASLYSDRQPITIIATMMEHRKYRRRS